MDEGRKEEKKVIKECMERERDGVLARQKKGKKIGQECEEKEES